MYYPDESVLYSGGDSLVIEKFYPNGDYTVAVRLQYSNNTTGADYSFEITGLNDATLFQFNDEFLVADTSGTVKTRVIIAKSKNTYSIKRK